MENTFILIAGGSGLIGKRLFAHLYEKGYDVAILSRKKQEKSAYYWNPEKGEIDTAILHKVTHLINLSGGTSVNGINYNEYSANTFTASTNSSGVGTLNVISSATTFTGVYGQKLHYLEILNSSSGSTIELPGAGGSFLRWRYTAPDFGSQNWIGGNSISATTSGDACNNITYDTSYRIINTGATPNIGSTVYSGTTGTNLVNGNNKWISVYSAPVPVSLGYSSGFTYNTKYVIQLMLQEQ